MYMVASWACEVTEILTHSLYYVRKTVTSQAQLATIFKVYASLFLLHITLFKNSFSCKRLNIYIILDGLEGGTRIYCQRC